MRRNSCEREIMSTMGTELPFIIRAELPRDRQQVAIVNEAAFGRSDEADLIDGLQAEGVVFGIARRRK